MFESAEIGHAVDDESYAARMPALREALLATQFELLEKRSVSVLIVVGGVDGAGKGDTVNQLQTWLDPRHVRVHGIGAASDEERERPPMFRYWRLLPPRGTIGVFMGSWYTDPIVGRVLKHTKKAELDTAMEHARHFERMLANERVVVLKLWFHLSKEEQRVRLKRLQKDPATRWRVTESDWERFALYDRFFQVSSRAVRETSTDYAPWLVVSGADRNYRELAVGTALLEAMRRGLANAATPPPPPILPHAPPAVDDKRILDTLDMSAKAPEKGYREAIEKQQGRLNLLTRHPKFGKDRALIVVFEGADAAGKGGAIRRITSALDARAYTVVPIAAPTDEESARPYLWRFWRHLPRRGHTVIFDRSWYGRVLVERVEGFAPQADWVRAYSEINEFEEELVEHGLIVVKLWLQIDQEEQLARFQAREQTGFKRFKITDEDWRNRAKWDEYASAVNDMIERTSTELAPWTLVAANDKRYARLRVLEALGDAVEKAL